MKMNVVYLNIIKRCLNDLLKVYRNTTWEELVIAAQLAEGSGATEYKDVNLNGGYF